MRDDPIYYQSILQLQVLGSYHDCLNYGWYCENEMHAGASSRSLLVLQATVVRDRYMLESMQRNQSNSTCTVSIVEQAYMYCVYRYSG